MSGDAESESGTPQRPRRDVSARTAIGNCAYCGGNANSTLGGEHIWKCSEVVSVSELEELIEEWRSDVLSNEETERRVLDCAEELREVL